MESTVPGVRRTVSSRDAARRLRATERQFKTTDAAWVRQTFGEVAWPLGRTWLAVNLAVDVIALALILFGVLVVLPVAFAGFVLGNIAVCMHFERQSRSVGDKKNR